jgi:hypothetical protein
MADQNGSSTVNDNTVAESKGKGKATVEPQTEDTGMDVDESSDDDVVDDVSINLQA